MEDMNIYNKHYISVDDACRIVDGFSDGLREPSDTDICINEQGGYQFRLFPGGEENPFLYERTHSIPLYKYENGKVMKRTAEEIAADLAELSVKNENPSYPERLEAQIMYTAMMTDTLLEV